MAEPFLAEIRLFGADFVPDGWAKCDGQLLPINQNQALFALLGTNFGGDGRVNFGLPDMRGRVPIHVLGNAFVLGQKGGEQAHTLSIAELPQHVHFAQASSAAATASIPSNSLVLAQGQFEAFRAPSSLAAMAAGTVQNVGGSQAHLNMQPFLTITFGIALQGIFPGSN